MKLKNKLLLSFMLVAVLPVAASLPAYLSLAGVRSKTDGLGKTILQSPDIDELRVSATKQIAGMESSAGWIIWVSVAGVAAALAAAYFVGSTVSKSTVAPINESLSGLSNAADSLFSSASQMYSGGRSLAENAVRQTNDLRELTSGIEEMSSIATKNTGVIQKNDAMFAEFSRLIGHAVDEIERTLGIVEKIQTGSEEMAKMTKELDEMAFQTKILALNAAVEAERAGEGSKGFGIVADELKKIARKSMEASKKTSELTNSAFAEFSEASKSAKETALSLKSIRTYEADTSMMINQIIDTMRAQTEGLSRIREALTRVDSVARQNTEDTRKADLEMSEMSEEAKKLNSNIWQLKKMIWGQPSEQQTPSIKGVLKTEVVAHQKIKMGSKVNNFTDKAAPRTGGVALADNEK